MKLILLLIISLFSICFGQCGTKNDSIPQLRITVADISWAGTDSADKFYARILYGTTQTTSIWSEWIKLDTNGCDDLDKGQIDYYDFTESTKKWMAIALYMGKDFF